MLFRVRGSDRRDASISSARSTCSPEAGKLPADVDSAFAHAKTIAFETSLDSLQMRAAELMTRAPVQRGATLRSSLSPAGLAKADSVLKLYGLTVDQVNRFKPWFVSMLMTQIVMQHAKFEAQYGVDMQLNARAQAGEQADDRPRVGRLSDRACSTGSLRPIRRRCSRCRTDPTRRLES